MFGCRAGQLAKDPSVAPWIVRAVVSEPDGAVVGDAGFHGPPDEAGMVEVGYTVVPGYRRRGCARAMPAALLVRAADEPAVTARTPGPHHAMTCTPSAKHPPQNGERMKSTIPRLRRTG